MKFSFNDIYNEDIYKSANVIFVTGQYNIFNNIVIDKFKLLAKGNESIGASDDLLGEFGVSNSNERISTYVDFNTFINVINTPSINGKWFCVADLSLLNAKQKEILNKYISNSNSNGILVIVSHNYRDFRQYLFNRVLLNSNNAHIIQLGFPNRSLLYQIVTDLFADRKVKIGQQSAEYFVMRMSSAYDDYIDVINQISLGYTGNSISYEQMQQELKGIDNYIIDDFIEKMLKPIGSDAIKTNRTIYKIMASLLREMGASKIISTLKYKIDDYIEFRIAINNGSIPIKVKYSVVEAKKRLEGNRISKIADFRFRQMARIASLTSLKDLVHIKLLINDIDSNSYGSEEKAEKILHAIVHRTVYSREQLNTYLGLENSIEKEIEILDSIKYDRG